MKHHYARAVNISISCVLAVALFTFTPLLGIAQQCPQADGIGPQGASEARRLEGRLVFHNGIRKWFELKLDEPQCGQASIELVRVAPKHWRPLEVLRGCRVRSSGSVGFSTTGYYSLDLYQDVQEVEPIGRCKTQLAFPDYSRAKPDRTIRAYRVDMRVDYEPGDHPIIFRVSSKGRELQPWQAYASYMLTGGFVLYGYCGEGFVVDRVFGTPEANPSHFDDPPAAFDPENAAAAGKKNMHLGYTCIRKR
jgi:hypothetical protein